jgi:hypothetical protein
MMPWQKDDKGALVLDADSGNPIFKQDGDGKEYVVDYSAMAGKLQQAAKGEEKYRKELAELKARMEPVKDVADLAGLVAEHAKLAEENKRLLENTDASKIEESVKRAQTQLEKAWQEKERSWTAQMEAAKAKQAEAAKTMAELNEKYRDERVRQLFNESQVAKEKSNLPPSILRTLFSKLATIDESGEFCGLDEDGGKMLEVDGKAASFDEWLYQRMEKHPEGKTVLLKGLASTGPGGGGNGGQGAAGGNPFQKGPSWNVTEQNRLAKENPTLAMAYAREAGIKNFSL